MAAGKVILFVDADACLHGGVNRAGELAKNFGMESVSEPAEALKCLGQAGADQAEAGYMNGLLQVDELHFDVFCFYNGFS